MPARMVKEARAAIAKLEPYWLARVAERAPSSAINVKVRRPATPLILSSASLRWRSVPMRAPMSRETRNG